MCEVVREMQDRITTCIRESNSFERDILKTVVGEIQTVKSRTGEITNDQAIKIIKKFKQGVLDTIKIMESGGIEEHPEELDSEIEIYEQYIPQVMSVDEIVDFLSDHDPELLTVCKSDGQATGIAMGIIKRNGLSVDGKDVSIAVKQLRS